MGIKSGNEKGLGHPIMGGVVGPGGSFVGRKTPQDVTRKTSGTQMGVDSGPRGGNSGNPGVKKGMTGGMNKKRAGVVGAGRSTGV